MDKAGIDTWAQRSRALDLDGIAWEDVPRVPLASEAVRVLRYMQDIESHTVVYVRELLATRVIDDPEVSTFLACWFYEETFHGRALARFLTAAGHPPIVRRRSQATLASRLEERAMGLIARAWPDFAAVHMVWGAINELTTLTGYQRLTELAPHPVLVELLARIMRDESRHFTFYYRQAERRLGRPSVQRVARFLVDHFWDPVGSGVQPDSEVRFLAGYLLGGPDGRAAARKIDDTIRRLPGFAGVKLMEAWVERACRRAAQPMPNAPSSTSARRGQDRVQASLAMACSSGVGSISTSAPSSADGRP
jgi:hypothetical protein